MKRRCLLLAAALALANAAFGQVTTDGTMGPRVNIPGPHYSVHWTLGSLRGNNLFHSLSVFNVRQGHSAAFTGPPGLRNIIARITDPGASVIGGAISSDTPDASLYLINPSGIIFGPGASINVSGSFYASTAHYVRFADGTRLESRIGPDVTLTVSAPTALGFDSNIVAPIVARGASFRAVQGGTLGFVGGAVGLGGLEDLTLLRAPGGRVIVVGVAGPGEVEHGASTASVPASLSLADVTIGRNTLVDVDESESSFSGAGSIFFRGDNVTIEESRLLARTRSANGRGIDIGAQRDLVIRHGEVSAITTGEGAAGSISLSGNNVILSEGSLVDTSCDPGCSTGSGGRLEVRAGNVFLVDGSREAPTFFVSNSFGGGTTGEIEIVAGTMIVDGNASIQGIGLAGGDATSIRIRSDQVVLRDGGQVDASARGTGRGGNISIENAGTIVIQGARADDSENGALLPSGIFSNTEGTGDAGRIAIWTENLDMSAGGEISSSARRGSHGNGGGVAITASGSIRLAGTDAAGKPTGIATNTFAEGDAGRITLAAATLEIVDEGHVQSQSEGAGQAGRIEITGGDLRLANRGQVSSDARATGAAGAIDVRLSGTLSIEGRNAGIFAKTYAQATGGGIVVEAAEIGIDGAGGMFASTDGTGDAGSVIVLSRGAISIANGGRIASETSSSGRAGDLHVRSAGPLRLAGGGEISTSSGLGGGDAGTVRVATEDVLEMSTNARISSESAGAGLAGDLLVRANGVQLSKGAEITTSARFSDGGNIRIESPSSVVLVGATIATAVGQGMGDGGNIVVDTPLLLLRDGVVSANAFGGDGGNIRIAAANLFANPATRVTASSQLGIDGVVAFDSPAIDLSGALLSLATGFLDLGAIAAGRCGARLAAATSSLVVRRFDPDESLRNGFLLARNGQQAMSQPARRQSACEGAYFFAAQ